VVQEDVVFEEEKGEPREIIGEEPDEIKEEGKDEIIELSPRQKGDWKVHNITNDELEVILSRIHISEDVPNMSSIRKDIYKCLGIRSKKF
jgi:hypothetical protein